MPNVVTGVNDLETYCQTNKEMLYLLDEWEGSLNPLSPREVACKSSKKVYWKCREQGHVWLARVSDRTSHKSGCPECNYSRQTSLHEQTFFYYIKSCFPDAVSSYRASFLGKREIDIYIPSLHLGIEYDGRTWHKNPKKDYVKSEILKANGIRLIRIREDNTELKDGSVYIHVDEKATSSDTRYLRNSVLELFDIINNLYELAHRPDVNIERDTPKMLALIERSSKEASLAVRYPMIASEWDYEKNAPLLPERVSCSSNRRVWWLCGIGHSYCAPIQNRTLQHQGCPICSGKRVLEGFNDLAYVNSELAEEWDMEKNDGLLPTQVTSHSGKRVWWKCHICGFSWRAVVSDRTNGSGCPNCRRTLMAEKLSGDNNPMYGRSGKNSPSSIPVCSYTKKGEFVQEYESATIAYGQTGIDNSSISSCIKGVLPSAGGLLWRRKEDVLNVDGTIRKTIEVIRKDLEFIRPDVMAFWHPTKNGDIRPDTLTVSSAKVIWLQCSNGHEWRKKVYEVTKKKPITCPQCAKTLRLRKRGIPGQMSFDFGNEKE